MEEIEGNQEEQDGKFFRTPTFREAAAHFQISSTTIATWWKQREKIMAKERKR
jgi:hypothetical protein